MSTKEVKNLFQIFSNDIAFIIGNGINLHYKNDSLSWKNLLLDLWNNYSPENISEIPEGISFTEFYDALEIQNTDKPNFGSTLQKKVQSLMKNWVPNNKQNLILNRIKDLNAPVLTTNFDQLIPKSLNLNFKKMESKGFTDFYPWSCYYSDKDLQNPVEGFGIWYPNGMQKYHRSIKLGLSQYMGNVERARDLIHKSSKNINSQEKNQNYWDGHRTWLHIIFNKSLVVFGLDLKENEVFLRWLLIERAKYYKKFPVRKHSGWFITIKGDNSSKAEGKKFFLKSIGFKVIELDDYKNIYEDIWK